VRRLTLALVVLAACATPTYQQSLDTTLRDVTSACEVVTSPEAAATIPPAKLAAAKQACHLAERAIISAETSYAAAKLAADPQVQSTQQRAADAALATAQAQLAAVEATR
jgi:hypothetical protein